MNENNYVGYKELTLTEDQTCQMYNEGRIDDYHFLENEYLLAKNDDGEIFDKMVCRDGKLQPVRYATFKNSYTGALKPRNEHQELAFEMLKNPDITVKLITGTWGTGKTLALVVAALEAVQRGDYQKIVWVRNNVQVKDTDNLGALPGEAFDKLLPYLGPFCDHVGGEEGVHMLIEHGQLEVIPLGFLRGRSIRDSIIICSEAENLTKEHIQLLLGRVDVGSALWIDGDARQRDRATFEKSKGLETMIDRLKGEKLFGYVHLVKSERSATARLADKLN
jgi:predicted ribonuclease YlaK